MKVEVVERKRREGKWSRSESMAGKSGWQEKESGRLIALGGLRLSCLWDRSEIWELALWLK